MLLTRHGKAVYARTRNLPVRTEVLKLCMLLGRNEVCHPKMALGKNLKHAWLSKHVALTSATHIASVQYLVQVQYT